MDCDNPDETAVQEKPKQRPYICPEHLYQKMEAEALERRKSTGEVVYWSTVLREILEKHYVETE